ncbi:MAG: hypothetical protein IPP74_00900 [Alphaproteobacteria bacterium]|nr:hypothetical protein [Alphaproteobacteria bacterium]
MFRSKTVFVVGAGASKEVNLPVGEELKRKISQKIDIKFENGFQQSSGCYNITEALRRHVKQPDGRNGDINPYLHSAWKVKDALSVNRSIDNALLSLSHDDLAETCGKFGIVSSILEAEKHSKLFYKPTDRQHLNFDGLQDTWYPRFLNMLAEEVSGHDAASIFENVSFVSFNYDRCIEHYLYEALQKRFALDQPQTKNLLDSLTIFHPYGSIGALPWQNTDPYQHVPYGSERSDFLAISKNIKTFNENFEDSETITKLRERLFEAETIVFLGFAFHKKNMELISPGKKCKTKRIYATAHGISKSDCNFLMRDIRTVFQINDANAIIEFRDGMKCAELFDEYWLSLTC